MGSENASLLAVTTGLSHKGCGENGPSLTCLAKVWINVRLDSGTKAFLLRREFGLEGI